MLKKNDSCLIEESDNHKLLYISLGSVFKPILEHDSQLIDDFVEIGYIVDIVSVDPDFIYSINFDGVKVETPLFKFFQAKPEGFEIIKNEDKVIKLKKNGVTITRLNAPLTTKFLEENFNLADYTNIIILDGVDMCQNTGFDLSDRLSSILKQKDPNIEVIKYVSPKYSSSCIKSDIDSIGTFVKSLPKSDYNEKLSRPFLEVEKMLNDLKSSNGSNDKDISGFFNCKSLQDSPFSEGSRRRQIFKQNKQKGDFFKKASDIIEKTREIVKEYTECHPKIHITSKLLNQKTKEKLEALRKK